MELVFGFRRPLLVGDRQYDYIIGRNLNLSKILILMAWRAILPRNLW
jgi:hypothetical protein